MNLLLETVASNCLIAAALAVVVALIARCRVNPTLVHFLLLLVLIKLFTPPVLPVRVTGLLPLRTDERPETLLVGQDASLPLVAGSFPEEADAPDGRIHLLKQHWQAAAIALWAMGILCVVAITVLRISAFQVLLRRAAPAPDFLEAMAKKLCRKMGVRTVPEILVLPVRITPAVWSLTGTPRLILPVGLIHDMGQERLETIIAHELAHVRRRDHLARILEFAATTVFWWNPLVWWVRRQMRELEEQCCDAIVLDSVANAARNYAIALIDTLEFLSQEDRRLPIGATAAKPTVSLSRRIEMLKTGTNARRLTARSVLATVCLLALPMALALADESPSSAELKTKVYDLGSLQANAENIEQQILDEVEPARWSRADGPFTMRRTGDGSLVVSATPAVHEHINALLQRRADSSSPDRPTPKSLTEILADSSSPDRPTPKSLTEILASGTEFQARLGHQSAKDFLQLRLGHQSSKDLLLLLGHEMDEQLFQMHVEAPTDLEILRRSHVIILSRQPNHIIIGSDNIDRRDRGARIKLQLHLQDGALKIDRQDGALQVLPLGPTDGIDQQDGALKVFFGDPDENEAQ